MKNDEARSAVIDFLETNMGACLAGALWAFWLRSGWDTRDLEPAIGGLALDGRVTFEKGLLRLLPNRGTLEAKVSKNLATAWAAIETIYMEMGNLDQDTRRSLEVALGEELPELTIEKLHTALRKFAERAFAILCALPDK